MGTKKITIERFSITSTKPFAEVVSAIAAQVGHHFNTKQFRFHGPDGFRTERAPGFRSRLQGTGILTCRFAANFHAQTLSYWPSSWWA